MDRNFTIGDVHNLYQEKMWRFENYKPHKLGTPERIQEESANERHLLRLQYHCKNNCFRKDILNIVWDDLHYFGNLRKRKPASERQRKYKMRTPLPRHKYSRPFVIAWCLYSFMKEDRDKNYHRDIRIYVYFMFIELQKQRFFDWYSH